MSVMETEWRKLPVIDWRDHFAGEIPKDAAEFWCAVHDVCDAGGRPIFQKLASFALRVLSLPFSNAYVERVFSVMNSTKSKERNSLRMHMLVAVLLVRLGLKKSGCCKSFEPTRQMYELFTAEMYEVVNASRTSTEASTDDENEVFMQCLNQVADEDEDIVEV